MEISREFSQIVDKLVSQKQGELSREQSQHSQSIRKKWARAGWNIPPGEEISELNELQVESIRRKGGIVWDSLEQTLDAFDLSFYPDLAAQLHSLAESYFPLSLCNPRPYMRRMGLTNPLNDERAEEQFRCELENARVSSLTMVKTKIDLYMAKKRTKSMNQEFLPVMQQVQKEWDLFICHASEDKKDFVDSFAKVLSEKNVSVWYDKFCIGWGDSIRQSIDKGLRSCKFGIVVFSHSFFQKKWPQEELDALHERMTAGKTRILPIWHKIDKSDIDVYSPLFSGRLARTSEQGIDALSNEIELIVRRQEDN
jgi:hypothetical protein